MASTQSSQEILSERKDEESEGSNEKSNFLLRLILYHYGDTKYDKSPEQIAREENLVPGVGIRFNRWFLLPAAIIIQFCCGSLYAWSVFNRPIDLLIYGKVVNMAPITFYIAVGCFGISAALMGPWLERHGPMISCLLGTSLFTGGNYLSAIALHFQQIWLVFVGYGIMSGLGLGLCYISPVSALQKWFPDRRGLASGMAVCGFGAGSIAIAKIQLPLYHSVGLPWTFVILGSIYLLLMVMSGLVLRTPPPNFSVDSLGSSKDTHSPTDVEGQGTASERQKSADSHTANVTLIEALTSRNYKFMYVMLLANSIFGLVVISRLANMIKDVFQKTEDEGATVVAINGVFNLGGRLFFSVSSDYIGRKNCFFLMLTFQLIILGTFSTITTTQTYWAFLMTMWILTACYGAGFGVIPAFLSDTFGPTNIGACHGVILTAWSLAGVVGGLIFTAIFNSAIDTYDLSNPHPYNINVWWMFGIVLIGWVALLFVKPTAKDEAFLKKPRELLERTFNRIANRERTFEMN